MPKTLEIKINGNSLSDRATRAVNLVARYRTLMNEMKKFAGEQAGQYDLDAVEACRQIANDELVERASAIVK